MAYIIDMKRDTKNSDCRIYVTRKLDDYGNMILDVAKQLLYEHRGFFDFYYNLCYMASELRQHQLIKIYINAQFNNALTLCSIHVNYAYRCEKSKEILNIKFADKKLIDNDNRS